MGGLASPRLNRRGGGMMQRPLTTDHAACDDAMIERGLSYLEATDPLERGPCIPALKRLGLTAREACAAARLHHLNLAGGAHGPS